VPDGYDIHKAFVVVDRIEDAVVPNADAPEVSRSFQLAATGRPRLPGQGLYLLEGAADVGGAGGLNAVCPSGTLNADERYGIGDSR